MADVRLATLENLNLSLPPNNEILMDDKGKPSVMVKIPRFNMSDVGLSGGVHPAFIVNGVTKDFIYISKYQNIVEGDRAYSLPYQQPRNYVSFDQAKTYCENKGTGWHLMTNAEWAAIALWCKKNGTMPYGNNNRDYGDYYNTWEKGAPVPGPDGYGYAKVLTGSGPASWAHNHDPSGIYDLNGNVFEWVGGVRLNAGEIQIIANNDAAQAVDQSATSPLWKAMAQNGSLVAPGTENTLKYAAGSVLVGDGYFKNITAAGGVTIPTLLKALALFPADSPTTYNSDYFYTITSGERLPFRGGDYNGDGGAGAGVFYCSLDSTRANAHVSLGFRSAYVEL